MNLFQYWDAPPPPEDVQVLIDGWRQEAGFRHQLHDRVSAERLMAEAAGGRGVAAFRLCAYAAMESDLFRLAALALHGGAYVDADIGSKGGLLDFLEPGMRGFVLGSGAGAGIANGVLLAKAPGDPLILAALDLALRNIEGRVSNVVSEVTGPGVFTALHDDPATAHLFDGFPVIPRPDLRRAVRFVQPAYKQTLADWRVAAYFPDQFSIYRDP